jgi:hypothetical protein
MTSQHLRKAAVVVAASVGLVLTTGIANADAAKATVHPVRSVQTVRPAGVSAADEQAQPLDDWWW